MRVLASLSHFSILPGYVCNVNAKITFVKACLHLFFFLSTPKSKDLYCCNLNFDVCQVTAGKSTVKIGKNPKV